MTTPQGMLELADEIEKARNAYLDAIGRGPGGEVEKRALTELLWDNKGTFAPALRQAAAPQGRGVLEACLSRVRLFVQGLVDDTEHRFGQPALGGRQTLAEIDDALALTPAVAPDGAGEARERCDWPAGEFSFRDEPGEHDPCYVVMPGGAMLSLNHHAREGVDIARAHFIIDACNAALAQTQEPGEDREIAQHVGWLKQYVAGMDETNWRDMRLHAERQLESLTLALSGGRE